LLLRTVGKYMGMIRRQAAEFRAQFDEAMRESELDQIRKDVENLGKETEATLRDAESSIEKEMSTVEQDVKSALETASAEPPPDASHATELGALEPVATAPQPAASIADATPTKSGA
jgi:sec-independent protein translocase protein TatB